MRKIIVTSIASLALVSIVAQQAAFAAGNGSGSGSNPFSCANKPDQPKCKKK